MTAIQEFPFGAFVVETAFLGGVAAFALGDGTVRLVDGGEERKVDAHSGAILSATPIHDRGALLTGGDDGRVALTDAAGKVTEVAELPRKWIDHVAAGPGGAVAYAAGKRVIVRLGDGRERQFDLPRAAGGLAFAPKGLRLAISSYDGITLRWVGTEAEPVSFAWKGAHLAVSFSPDGRYVVSAMQENALHGWKIADGGDMRMSGYPAKTRSLAWTAKGRYLATSGAYAAILWPFHFKDGPMGKEPAQLAGREALVTRVACHPKKEQVAIGYQDGAVVLAGVTDATETLLRQAGDGPVSALAFDRAGALLAFGTENGAGGVVSL
jgi:WD40 repeat protein